MEKTNDKLSVLEYSQYPGPRYCLQGECSGEDFYHKKLNPEFANAFLTKKKLTVDLDGTAGYASSFLDEAFGNLVYDFGKSTVEELIEIKSNQEPDWLDMIKKEVFSDWEDRRILKKEPKKTEPHDEWYRLIEGKLSKKKWL